MLHKKVYLITGATGFIGSCLLRRLISNNEEVHIIVRKESKFWRIKDILDKVACHISDLSSLQDLKKIIDKIRPTIIYHLAASSAYHFQNEPGKFMETDILGTWNLIRAISYVDYELFVNTGSSAEYGFKKLPMKETDLLQPESYHAVTKCAQTLLSSYIARKEKRPIVTLRPFSVYGPYEGPARFIPALLKSLYFGEKINLVSPEISHDQIYVDDVVDTYLLVDKLKKYSGEIFNIGTGKQSSIKDIVEIAVRVTGRITDFKWGHMEKRRWDTTNWVADISKAKQLLGWTPKINLEKGLFLTWKWYESNHHFYAQKYE